jgi:hypothetical protein
MALAAKRANVLDIERQLEDVNNEIRWERLSSWEKAKEVISMVIQKSNAPSVQISPAVIGLLFTIILQAGIGIWWASSMAKEVEFNKQEINSLKSTVETQKVYIDTSREKQIKLEAAIETLEKQQQQTNLILQMKGK